MCGFMKYGKTKLFNIVWRVGLLVIAGLVIWRFVPGQNQPPVVRFTADGFQPWELTVSLGTTVTFQNRTRKYFWPASDVHPNHQLYPEFDPRSPVDPRGDWKFTFGKPGRFDYHDHLAPAYTGVILVRDQQGRSPPPRDCLHPQDSEREACWDQQLLAALDKGGVKQAFAEMGKLYREDPAFSRDGCHHRGHRLGELTYIKYIKGRDMRKLELPPESVECGFGFYHGVLEHLFRDNPDPVYAADLCNYLIEKYQKTVPGINLNCYHGTGHGFVPDPPAKKDWGNPRAIVEPAVAKCQATGVAHDSSEYEQCLEGIYNVLWVWIYGNQYGFTRSPHAPYFACQDLGDKLLTKACYYEAAMHISGYAGFDIGKMTREYVEPIADQQLAQMVLDVAATTITQRYILDADHSRFIDQCRALGERWSEVCILGIAGGLMAHGEPEVEYVKAGRYCASPKLSEAVRAACFSHIQGYFRSYYAGEKLAGVCREMEKNYGQKCNQ